MNNKPSKGRGTMVFLSIALVLGLFFAAMVVVGAVQLTAAVINFF